MSELNRAYHNAVESIHGLGLVTDEQTIFADLYRQTDVIQVHGTGTSAAPWFRGFHMFSVGTG
jgi:hypothetical protein